MFGSSRSFPVLFQSLSSGDPTNQLVALTELCEVLSLSTEEQLGGFRVSEYVHTLVTLLECGASPEICLLAARALTNLLEVSSAFAGSIVASGGVAALCSKLLLIDSIDVAEQALSAISKLALERPSELLRGGALAALMQHIVFFPTNIQRTAFVTAALIVQELDHDMFSLAMQSAPLLLEQLESNNGDEKILAQIFLFFSRVVEQTGQEEHLQLHAMGFTSQACQGLKASLEKPRLYSPSTVSLIVNSLLLMCQSSSTISLDLIQMDVVPTLVAMAAQASASPVLHELMALALELLPEDPTEPLIPQLELTQTNQPRTTMASMVRLLSEERRYSPMGFSSALADTFSDFSSISSMRALRTPLAPSSNSLSSEDSTPAIEFMTASPSSAPLAHATSTTDTFPFLSLADAMGSLANVPETPPPPSSEMKLHSSSSSYSVPSSSSSVSSSSSSSSSSSKRSRASPVPAASPDSCFLSCTSVPASSAKRPSLQKNKLEWLKARPELHLSISQALLSMFVSTCNATASAAIRHLCVRGVLRIIQSIPSVESLQNELNISQFAANLLQFGLQNADYPLLSAVITIIDSLAENRQLYEEFVRAGLPDNIRECTRPQKRLRKASPLMSPYSGAGQFGLSSATASSVQALAQKCLRHFPEETACTTAEVALKDLGVELKAATEACSVLTRIHDALAESITPHELIRSNVVKSLIEYLTQSTEGDRSAKVADLRSRQRLFCHVFFGLPKLEDFHVGDDQIDVRVLIHERTEQNKLAVTNFKAALEAVEKFVPEFYESLGGFDTRVEFLSQPFKIRLNWKEERTRPTTRASPVKQDTPTFNSRVVMVDPLATMQSIETHLLSQEGVTALFATPVGAEKKVRETEDEVFIREAKKAHEATLPIHLMFEFEGMTVFSTTSVLEAVQMALRTRGKAGGDCRSIWGKTYDIHFSKAKQSGPVKHSVSWPSPARLSSLAEENLKFPIAEQPVDQLFQLLRCCFDLSQQWPLLYDMNAEGLHSGLNNPLVAPLEFVSEKLSKRVQMQIEDPIAMSGAFPSWCSRICEDYPFVISFPVRRLYFKLTAFDPPQHLHTLQAYQASSDSKTIEGSPTLERDGSRQRRSHRIQQVKFRVHRANVLDATCSLLEVYGKRRNFLRAEFIGEEGVGLGPTLELFALVSHQIQQRKHHMWFESDAEVVAEKESHEPSQSVRALRSSKFSPPPSKQALSPCVTTKFAIERARAQEFYRLGVCVCTSCHLVEFPRCTRHNNLLKLHESGHLRCPKRGCKSAAQRKCRVCSSDREVQEWFCSKQEVGYLKAAFPPSSTVHPHFLLRCPRCLCVNFPGTDTILTSNCGGQIVTHAGRVMSEKDYRDFTPHLSTRCTSGTLEKVPVLLPAKEVQQFFDLVASMETADHDASLQFEEPQESLPSPAQSPRLSPPRVLSSPTPSASSPVPTSFALLETPSPAPQSPTSPLRTPTTPSTPLTLPHSRARPSFSLSPLPFSTPSSVRSADSSISIQIPSLPQMLRANDSVETFRTSHHRSRVSFRPNTSPVPEMEQEQEYVESSCGLFPTPFAPSLKPGGSDKVQNPKKAPKTRLEYFTFLGHLMGQALLEDRLLDIPFSLPLLQLILGEPVGIHSLLFINPYVGKSMLSLRQLAIRVANARKSEPAAKANRKRPRNTGDDTGLDVLLLGCPISDLVLDFTVPGHPNMELKAGGSNCAVDLDNLGEYVDLVCSVYLRAAHVQEAVNAIRKGLGEIVRLSSLSCFSVTEFQELLGGDSETLWDFSIETLKAHVAGRGYNNESRPMQWLFAVLSELTGKQQRAFIRFVTGSPRLPIGGLKALKPPLTVVRVPCTLSAESPSCNLPSAMTCSSYLKLPDYPSKEVLYQKLLYSISECQTGFQLS